MKLIPLTKKCKKNPDQDQDQRQENYLNVVQTVMLLQTKLWDNIGVVM